MTELQWEQLHSAAALSENLFDAAKPANDIFALQPRLASSVSLFFNKKSNKKQSSILLVAGKESTSYLSLLAEYMQQFSPEEKHVIGGHYHISGHSVTLSPAKSGNDNFAATDYCLFSDWFEFEQLLGSLRQIGDDQFTLSPGLIHKANGGVLVLSLRTLLAQPLLWLRLKNILLTQEHHWSSTDENKPLPLSVPPIPVNLRLVLVGNYGSLADFQEFEPELYQTALFSEFEREMPIHSPTAIIDWLSYVKQLARLVDLPDILASAYPFLIKSATRECNDQLTVSLCPDWITELLQNAEIFSENSILDAEAFYQSIENKQWRENYLPERVLSDIYQQQVLIQTRGERIGQINGLSVIEYPGHPKAFGEPSRISCVLQSGTGEFTDVEQRVELGGSLHAKGMIIMSSFIANALALEQQLPFSATLVFEQSYSGIDGDSASLAGLCAYLSALSLQPIDQQFAVTGSVDQFGQVQPIGGINEKIEGFFNVCRHQTLTGKQGVIFPAANQRNLCLNSDVIDAVKDGQFHLYPVEHVEQAIELLTGIPYQSTDYQINIVDLIQLRIQRVLANERQKSPRWLRWFFR